MAEARWWLGSRAASPLLSSLREATSLWLCFYHLPERRVVLGGLQEQSQPRSLAECYLIGELIPS